MNLQETIQEQVDDVMDSFDFERCSEVLKLVELCWLNETICDEDRVYELKKQARVRMKNACKMAITAYESMRDQSKVIYKISNSGCLIGYCTIYTGDEEEGPWVKVNLTCYVDNSLNDGKNFE